MSSQEDLFKHLEEEKRMADERKVDWENLKTEWIKKVNNLVSQMQEWLKPATDKQLLSIRNEPGAVHEHDLGRYEVSFLTIRTPADKIVKIKPIGRIIIGAKGRVDLVAGGRKATLLVNSDDVWVFSNPQARRQPDRKLDEESFSSVLDDLIR